MLRFIELLVSVMVLTMSGIGLYQASIMKYNFFHLPSTVDVAVFESYAKSGIEALSSMSWVMFLYSLLVFCVLMSTIIFRHHGIVFLKEINND